MAERCNGQGELVFKYVEGVLPPEEQASFRQHLAKCEVCQRLQADFQRVAERARLLPPTESPPKEERVLRATPSRFSWNFTRALPTVIVVGLILAGLIYWTTRPGVPPRIESASPVDGAEGLEPGDFLLFIFNKDMDPESVVAAMKVEPALQLPASWQGRTLRLTLPPDVQRSMRYRVSISTEAKDANGAPLTEGASISFTTAAPPEQLIREEQVPWSADEITNVQMQVDAGTYDYRSSPELAAQRDLDWLMTEDERAEYGELTIKEEHLHRVIVALLHVDGGSRLELTLEQLGGKRETDPWFVTALAEYVDGTSAAAR